MRIIIQRVLSGSVTVDSSVISAIQRGIVVLVGICKDDTREDVEYVTRKLLNVRMFPNEDNGKRWDLSVTSLGLEVLLVSQFTLFGRMKGNSLDFSKGMGPTDAREFYADFVSYVKSQYEEGKVFDGEFGAMMNVQIENDGPVTITIDSKERNY